MTAMRILPALASLSSSSVVQALRRTLGRGRAWARRRRPGAPVAALDCSARRMAGVLLAPAQQDGRPRVLKAMLAAPGERLADAGGLADFAQALDASARRWTLLLPRDEYRVSVMPAPAVPAAELAQSVRWQLAPTLDFAIEDASIDFMTIPTEAWQPGRAPELYVIAARGDAMREHAGLFTSARLALAAIDIRETAQRNIAALAERSEELLVMIAFGENDVQISCNWQRELYMDRLIAESFDNDPTPDRRAAANERVVLQVQRSIEAVRGSYPFMAAARVLVAGAPDGFCVRLADSIPEPVETLEPEQLFDLSLTPELREPRLFMQHFHALGAALREMEQPA